MPTYAFQCANCGFSFEAKLGFEDPQPAKCDKCGGSLKRQYGNVGVSFRGSGFYRTDSRTSDVKSSSSGDSATKSAGGSGGSGSSD